jgi:hypothetical protein
MRVWALWGIYTVLSAMVEDDVLSIAAATVEG